MTDGKDKSFGVAFVLDEAVNVEWNCWENERMLTTEQAQVIGQIKGMREIADAVGDLAEAVRELASATRGES